jgi:hypothetical protein
MNKRKREGTVEILFGRRRLRRRKQSYKVQTEVGGDAGREVGRGHRCALSSALLRRVEVPLALE